MGEKPHKRLEAWRKSMDLTVRVYEVTAGFPPEERYGLVAQMRRAAVSVPSNIAEGAARGTSKLFSNALQIARGSLSELDTQVTVATRLAYMDQVTSERLAATMDEVDRILNGLIRTARRKVAAGVVGAILLFACVGL